MDGCSKIFQSQSGESQEIFERCQKLRTQVEDWQRKRIANSELSSDPDYDSISNSSIDSDLDFSSDFEPREESLSSEDGLIPVVKIKKKKLLPSQRRKLKLKNDTEEDLRKARKRLERGVVQGFFDDIRFMPWERFGRGNPEYLKGSMNGQMSRHSSDTCGDRLVYEPLGTNDEGQFEVLIHDFEGHYS